MGDNKPGAKDKALPLKTVFNTPWALDKSVLYELVSYLDTPLAQEDREAPARGATTNTATQVAIIPVFGVLEQRVSFIQRLFGGVGTEDIARDIRAAVADPRVAVIVLEIDSPGGSVNGIAALAEVILEAKQEKPVVAFVNSVAMSAAYWLASAATWIVLSSATARVGSIGVIAVHRDFSKLEERIGVKSTEIVAGQFKAAASPLKPLSEEGRAFIQNQVDKIYALFVQAVADNRGTTTDVVLESMAEGRVFMAQDAIDAGLADRIASLDTVLIDIKEDNMGANNPQANANTPANTGTPAPATNVTATEPTPQPVATETQPTAPAPAQAPQPVATQPAPVAPQPAPVATISAEQIQQIQAQERQRLADIDAIAANARPGQEALVQKAKTTPGYTAQQLAFELMSQSTNYGATQQQIAAEAPKPIDTGDEGSVNAEEEQIIGLIAAGGNNKHPLGNNSNYKTLAEERAAK